MRDDKMTKRGVDNLVEMQIGRILRVSHYSWSTEELRD